MPSTDDVDAIAFEGASLTCITAAAVALLGDDNGDDDDGAVPGAEEDES